MNYVSFKVLLIAVIRQLFTSNCVKSEDLKLTMLDPVSVGFEQKLKQSGRTLIIKTAAVQPPIFEIENYLTEDECDYIRGIAKMEKWTHSKIIPQKSAATENHKFNFTKADRNKDNLIGFLELWYVMPRLQDAMITVEDIPEFINMYNYDEDGDGQLSADEFAKLDGKLAYDWISNKMQTETRTLTRASNQVWIKHDSDDFLMELKERVVSLTGLSKRIIDLGSEQLQVVQYDIGGHYHAHYDSSNVDTRKCLHTRQIDGLKESEPSEFTDYIVCRYVTIMYYLNDVEKGGETAFPVADNATISLKAVVAGGKLKDLSNHCNDARLVVKPKKGKAVMWYNHLLNEDDWLGGLDIRSYHGGCDIKQGVKWIANHWINVDKVKERQISYMDLMEKKYGRISKRPKEEDKQQKDQHHNQQQQYHHQQQNREQQQQPQQHQPQQQQPRQHQPQHQPQQQQHWKLQGNQYQSHCEEDNKTCTKDEL